MDELSPNRPEMGGIRILIADDHALVRAGIRMLLESEPGMEVIGEAEDGAQALKLAFALRPAIVLADIRMPPPDGVELARLLCRDLPDAKTIIVSMHEDDDTVRDALAVCAAGYVIKRSGPSELINAIHHVAAGEVYLDKALRHRFKAQTLGLGD